MNVHLFKLSYRRQFSGHRRIIKYNCHKIVLQLLLLFFRVKITIIVAVRKVFFYNGLKRKSDVDQASQSACRRICGQKVNNAEDTV